MGETCCCCLKLKNAMIAILILDIIAGILYAINFFVGLGNKDDISAFSESIATLMTESDLSTYEGGYE